MGTIVAIDDEQEILSIYEEVGEIEGNHTVITFSDGVDALKYLEENKCDIVISDYRMANINGVKIYNKVKTMENNQNAHFIFVSAYIDEIKAEIGEPEDVIYQNKPISIPTLLEFLNSKEWN